MILTPYICYFFLIFLLTCCYISGIVKSVLQSAMDRSIFHIMIHYALMIVNEKVLHISVCVFVCVLTAYFWFGSQQQHCRISSVRLQFERYYPSVQWAFQVPGELTLCLAALPQSQSWLPGKYPANGSHFYGQYAFAPSTLKVKCHFPEIGYRIWPETLKWSMKGGA